MNLDREHMCDGKRAFPSLLAAQITKKRRRLNFSNVYRCRYCKKFHLGHTATGKELSLQRLIDNVCGYGVKA